jgi:hypothetical protein
MWRRQRKGLPLISRPSQEKMDEKSHHDVLDAAPK